MRAPTSSTENTIEFSLKYDISNFKCYMDQCKNVLSANLETVINPNNHKHKKFKLDLARLKNNLESVANTNPFKHGNVIVIKDDDDESEVKNEAASRRYVPTPWQLGVPPRFYSAGVIDALVRSPRSLSGPSFCSCVATGVTDGRRLDSKLT